MNYRMISCAAVAVLLSACGNGEPSEADMKSALEAELTKASALLGKINVLSFEKHDCKETGEGRYRCDFTMEAESKNAFTGKLQKQKSSSVGIFEKVGDKWTAKKAQ